MKRNFTYAITGLVCLLVVISSISSTMAATTQYFPVVGTETKYNYSIMAYYNGQFVMDNTFDVYNKTADNSTHAFANWILANEVVDLTGYVSLVNDTTIDLVVCYSEANPTTLKRVWKVILKDRTITYGTVTTYHYYANSTSWSSNQWSTHLSTTHDKNNYLSLGARNFYEYFDRTTQIGNKIISGDNGWTCLIHTSSYNIARWHWDNVGYTYGANWTLIANERGQVISTDRNDFSPASKFAGYTWTGWSANIVLPEGGPDIPGFDLAVIGFAIVLGFGAIYAFSLRRKSKMN